VLQQENKFTNYKEIFAEIRVSYVKYKKNTKKKKILQTQRINTFVK